MMPVISAKASLTRAIAGLGCLVLLSHPARADLGARGETLRNGGASLLGPRIQQSLRRVPPRATPASLDPARDAAWLKSLTLPDLPVQVTPRVVEYLRFYRDTERGRAIAQTWAKRSGRYTPALRAYLEEAGLPRDLVWLSLVESGHDPGIRSRAGALGLWQFMPATARLYGLSVDRWLDERLDPERSTAAALRFLKDLHQHFGSWELAMAAYNMGHGGLKRAIQKYNTNDYWLLSSYEAGLPWETVLYVPKVMATAIVMTNRKAFGIADIAPDAPEGFDTIAVESGRSLGDVAGAAGLPLPALKRLNPQLLAARLPPNTPRGRPWRVHLPLGTGQATSAKLGDNPVAPAGVRAYLTRFGETPGTIAAERSPTGAALTPPNPFAEHEQLAKSPLVWKASEGAERQTAPEKRVVALPARSFYYESRRQVFYEVLEGDTLAAVGRAFRVTEAELVGWNQLDPRAHLEQGLVLQVFVDKARSLSEVRYRDPENVQVFSAGSEAFCEDHERQKGRTRLVIAARRGDTLTSVGRRYGVSASVMERINQRSRRDPLSPGDAVVLYVAPWRARQAADHLVSSRPALPEVATALPKNSPREVEATGGVARRAGQVSLAPD